MAMKNILAFGDSLTWGFIAGTWERHPFDVRWPNVLAAGLHGKARDRAYSPAVIPERSALSANAKCCSAVTRNEIQ